MKRIAEAAAAQLARRPPDDVPMTAEEAVRLLARIARTGPPAARLRAIELLGIARTGPPAARLRAIELLGARMGLFRDARDVGPSVALSDEERAERIDAILERARQRRAISRGHGDEVAAPQENH